MADPSPRHENDAAGGSASQLNGRPRMSRAAGPRGAGARGDRRRLRRYRHLAALCDRPDFLGPAGVAPTPDNVLGAISLAIWTITVIVAIKYAAAGAARARTTAKAASSRSMACCTATRTSGARLLLWALMLGAGLLLGDGMITPAISVLSAVEGLDVATPAFAPYVVPITVALLTGLFAIQYKGASGIGVVFGPVLLVWFVVIAALGAARSRAQPAILAAFNPRLWRRLPARCRLARGDSDPQRADAGRHRRRGDVCRPRAFRRAADPASAGSPWSFPRSAAQLSRSGRVSAQRRAGRRRQAVLQPRAGAVAAAARAARYPGDDRRLAGAHIRRLFADLAGDRARSVSAARRPAHPSRPRRTDLHSRHQLGRSTRMRRAGPRVRLVLGARRSLRPRGRRRDADHVAGHVCRSRGATGIGASREPRSCGDR